MRTIRFLATIPKELSKELIIFARQQEVSASLVAQQAVTKNSNAKPLDREIDYVRGETEGVQLSFSETAYQLIELWSEQTGLAKSKLITYSLQQTFMKGDNE